MRDYTPRELAALEGRTTYQGQPCRRCGSRERYVSTSQCAVCRRRKAREQYDYIRELRRLGKQSSQEA